MALGAIHPSKAHLFLCLAAILSLKAPAWAGVTKTNSHHQPTAPLIPKPLIKGKVLQPLYPKSVAPYYDETFGYNYVRKWRSWPGTEQKDSDEDASPQKTAPKEIMPKVTEPDEEEESAINFFPKREKTEQLIPAEMLVPISGYSKELKMGEPVPVRYPAPATPVLKPMVAYPYLSWPGGKTNSPESK